MLRAEEFWNTGDMAIADEVYSVEFVNHDPTAPDVVDIESYKGFAAAVRAGMPDFQVTPEVMVAEGDKVASCWTATGTQTGELVGIPPTGIQARWTGITIYRYADGKVAEAWWSKDMAGFLEQLGVMPPTRQTYTWGEPSQVTGDAGDPETNKVLVQRMIDEVMNQQNLAVVDELFAADYLMHDPAWPMEVKGPEGFKEWAGAMLDPYFSDSRITIEDMIAEGDKVAVRWTWSGTHTGEFMGIPPTGRQTTVAGISIHRFADGKFVESWVNYDALGMMQQLTAEEWPLDGTWFGTNSHGHAIVLTITPLGPENDRFVCALDIAHDPSFGGMFPGTIAATNMRGMYVKTGLNTYDFTIMSYGLAEPAEGEAARQVVYIQVVSGQFILTDENTFASDLYTAALYAPDQDPFGDEPPAYGCYPVSGTYKRMPVV
ncbi:MAG: ester cyclase, partial [Planctomycetota bacterium]